MKSDRRSPITPPTLSYSFSSSYFSSLFILHLLLPTLFYSLQQVQAWKGKGRVGQELFRYDFANKQDTSTPMASATKLVDAELGDLVWVEQGNITWNAPGEGNGLSFTGEHASGLESSAADSSAVEAALLLDSPDFTMEVWLDTTDDSALRVSNASA